VRNRHTVALLSEGSLYSWGDQDHGVCGHGEEEGHQLSPRKIEGPEGVESVSACGFHTAAVTRIGEVLIFIIF